MDMYMNTRELGRMVLGLYFVLGALTHLNMGRGLDLSAKNLVPLAMVLAKLYAGASLLMDRNINQSKNILLGLLVIGFLMKGGRLTNVVDILPTLSALFLL